MSDNETDRIQFWRENAMQWREQCGYLERRIEVLRQQLEITEDRLWDVEHEPTAAWRLHHTIITKAHRLAEATHRPMEDVVSSAIEYYAASCVPEETCGVFLPPKAETDG